MFNSFATGINESRNNPVVENKQAVIFQHIVQGWGGDRDQDAHNGNSYQQLDQRYALLCNIHDVFCYLQCRTKSTVVRHALHSAAWYDDVKAIHDEWPTGKGKLAACIADLAGFYPASGGGNLDFVLCRIINIDIEIVFV